MSARASARAGARACRRRCPARAEERGIILADTKLEFGTLLDGRLLVIDELLTPDSSRYWPAEEYRVGTSPPNSSSSICIVPRSAFAFCRKKPVA